VSKEVLNGEETEEQNLSKAVIERRGPRLLQRSGGSAGKTPNLYRSGERGKDYLITQLIWRVGKKKKGKAKSPEGKENYLRKRF